MYPVPVRCAAIQVSIRYESSRCKFIHCMFAEGKKEETHEQIAMLCFTQARDAIMRTSEAEDDENDALHALTLFKELAHENEHMTRVILRKVSRAFREARVDDKRNTLLLRAVDKSMIVFVQAFIEYFKPDK